MDIRAFQPSDEAAVVALWHSCGLTRPWNDPHQDIARKLGVQRDWFLVSTVPEMTASNGVNAAADAGGRVIASIMVGYDGHRGWVNYLAVAATHRHQGHAARLMAHAEALLTSAGCPKLSLQVRQGNDAVLAFYEKLGYRVDATVSMGKRLIAD